MMRALALLLLVGCAACANPVPPSGGPVDSTPPRLVETVPDTGAVNVAAGVVRLTFSEAIDARSLSRALTVTPEGEAAPDVSVRGRTATIDLGPLRSGTTYVLTLDNALRDARGVPLAAPITVAFSTGAVLNRGLLAGRVVHPRTGEGVGGVDLYAYAAADTLGPLPTRPLYRTQTDPQGAFRFTYLDAGPFFVVAVEDANRNRRLDAGEAFAVPPTAALAPDSTTAGQWLLASPDTTAPRVERVRSYSQTRHALRLSEGVAWTGGAWQVSDTLGHAVPILSRYRWARVPQEVFFTTPARDRQVLVLAYGSVADSAGNVLPPGTARWTTAAAADTFGLRFEGFVPPDGRLAPGDSGAVRFSRPLPDSLRAALVFSLAPDSSLTPLPLTSTGTTAYTFGVTDSLTVVVRADVLGAVEERLTFRASTLRDVGEIEGRVAAVDATLVVVEAWRDSRRAATARADTSGAFVLRGLGAGPYTLRAFEDDDGDGRWSAGQLRPYRPAERIRWAGAPVEVRARWSNALAEPFSFADAPAPDSSAALSDTLRTPR